VTQAHLGDRVVIRVVGQDLGPSSVDSSIDISYIAFGRPHPHPPINLIVKHEGCYSQGFDHPADISPDGAVCEFGGVPAGTKVWVKVIPELGADAEREAQGPIEFDGLRDGEPADRPGVQPVFQEGLDVVARDDRSRSHALPLPDG
jgi:hypothetical protein